MGCNGWEYLKQKDLSWQYLGNTVTCHSNRTARSAKSKSTDEDTHNSTGNTHNVVSWSMWNMRLFYMTHLCVLDLVTIYKIFQTRWVPFTFWTGQSNESHYPSLMSRTMALPNENIGSHLPNKLRLKGWSLLIGGGCVYVYVCMLKEVKMTEGYYTPSPIRYAEDFVRYISIWYSTRLHEILILYKYTVPCFHQRRGEIVPTFSS